MSEQVRKFVSVILLCVFLLAGQAAIRGGISSDSGTAPCLEVLQDFPNVSFALKSNNRFTEIGIVTLLLAAFVLGLNLRGQVNLSGYRPCEAGCLKRNASLLHQGCLLQV